MKARCGKRLIDRSGPAGAMGGRTTCSLPPSARRASAIGCEASARAPASPSIRAARATNSSASSKSAPSKASRPQRFNPDLEGAVHELIGHAWIAHHSRQRAPPVDPVGQLRHRARHLLLRNERAQGEPSGTDIELGELVVGEYRLKEVSLHDDSRARARRASVRPQRDHVSGASCCLPSASRRPGKVGSSTAIFRPRIDSICPRAVSPPRPSLFVTTATRSTATSCRIRPVRCAWGTQGDMTTTTESSEAAISGSQCRYGTSSTSRSDLAAAFSRLWPRARSCRRGGRRVHARPGPAGSIESPRHPTFCFSWPRSQPRRRERVWARSSTSGRDPQSRFPIPGPRSMPDARRSM
ncbi:MAG: hypothetical protein QOH48_200 [Actinomycetota bacterium]|nr:hypothetical protein [Actinomycetota bacterium]